MNTLQLDLGHLHDHWDRPITLLTDHLEGAVNQHCRMLADAITKIHMSGVPLSRMELHNSAHVGEGVIGDVTLYVATRRSFWEWLLRRPLQFEPRYVVKTVYDVDEIEMTYRTTCEEVRGPA